MWCGRDRDGLQFLAGGCVVIGRLGQVTRRKKMFVIDKDGIWARNKFQNGYRLC